MDLRTSRHMHAAYCSLNTAGLHIPVATWGFMDIRLSRHRLRGCLQPGVCRHLYPAKGLLVRSWMLWMIREEGEKLKIRSKTSLHHELSRRAGLSHDSKTLPSKGADLFRQKDEEESEGERLIYSLQARLPLSLSQQTVEKLSRSLSFSLLLSLPLQEDRPESPGTTRWTGQCWRVQRNLHKQETAAGACCSPGEDEEESRRERRAATDKNLEEDDGTREDKCGERERLPCERRN